MENFERAKEILKSENISYFKTDDVFNPGNILSGYICYSPNDAYGRLVLFSVNDDPCEQVIYNTPKLNYPFDKTGKFHWPPIEKFEFWEKLDGTNILAYHYTYKDKDFVTYKTRLTPVIKDSKLVSFRELWLEYYTSNPWVQKVIEENPAFNLSFELYGSRNPITIKYNEPLMVSLLFGVRRYSGEIFPPSRLKCDNDTKVPFFMNVTPEMANDLTSVYNKMREISSAKNTNDLLTEGFVMYAFTQGQWKMYKAKPEEIEKIHWAASGSIPDISIKNTAINVFEDKENPTIDDLISLLREEYSDNLINKSMIKIDKAWSWAIDRINLTKQVNEVWKQAMEKGLDIRKDKNATMRFISQHFPKDMMSRVGGIILKQAGLL